MSTPYKDLYPFIFQKISDVELLQLSDEDIFEIIKG